MAQEEEQARVELAAQVRGTRDATSYNGIYNRVSLGSRSASF